MASDDVIALLGLWEGYSVGTVERFKAGKHGPTAQVWIELKRGPGPFVCSGCGRKCERFHDWEERWIRDLPMLDAETHLLVHRYRAECKVCGPKLEYLPWLARYSRVTTRFAENVARLCKNLAIKHVAAFYRLDWDAVKAIDKEYLERTLGTPDLSDARLLAMDEFAIKRGQSPRRPIFVEPHRKQVLWVCRGRAREDIRPFFEKLGPDGCRRIEAVAMDMSPRRLAAARTARTKKKCGLNVRRPRSCTTSSTWWPSTAAR